MLVALTVLNVAMVMLTRSLFSVAFMVSNGLNLLLAYGLYYGKSWARLLTVVRVLLGVALAVATAVTQGAFYDLAVTALLLGGIGLPLVGPPHRLKTVAGYALFTLGVISTVVALLSQLIAVA